MQTIYWSTADRRVGRSVAWYIDGFAESVTGFRCRNILACFASFKRARRYKWNTLQGYLSKLLQTAWLSCVAFVFELHYWDASFLSFGCYLWILAVVAPMYRTLKIYHLFVWSFPSSRISFLQKKTTWISSEKSFRPRKWTVYNLLRYWKPGNFYLHHVKSSLWRMVMTWDEGFRACA